MSSHSYPYSAHPVVPSAASAVVPARRAHYYHALTEYGRIFDLDDDEKWWRDHYQILLEHGYRLRYRYSPAWTPSWSGSDINPYFCDDAYPSRNPTVLDAMRTNDQAIVAIKCAPSSSNEARTAQHLANPVIRYDSNNQVAQVLNVFHDNSDPQNAFIVRHLARPFDSPPFSRVNEVIDFFRQTLEGLVFLHSKGIAHLNLTEPHIMMRADHLFPEGFHPTWQDRSAQHVHQPVRHLARSSVPPPLYIFVDFGKSSVSNTDHGPHHATGVRGLAPELDQDSIPHDAYCIDIFTLGKVFEELIKDYNNLDFLQPLVGAMTQARPNERPGAPNALDILQAAVQQQPGVNLRWNLQPRNQSACRRLVRNIGPALREIRRFWTIYVYDPVNGQVRKFFCPRLYGYSRID